jgi:OHCU decarboxylase
LSGDVMHDDALARLNAMPQGEAVAALMQCCTSSVWATAVSAHRPYQDVDALLEAADRIWNALGPAEWSEAFHGHPRIGDAKTRNESTVVQNAWSQDEQSSASLGGEPVRNELKAAQNAYEAKFGHIFLICATGKSAGEILESVRERMNNDPDTELRVAVEEQRRITRLRLEKLLNA